jgi:SAM-dependent methyltransferase
MKKGECDYVWQKDHDAVRQYSPTYIEANRQFKKYSRFLYGDVLDVGCGADVWQKNILSSNHNIKSYLGIDSSEFVINSIPFIAETFKFLRMDAEDFKLNKKFDCVILNGVIEHIADDEGVLDNIKRHLRTHGTLFISFPLSPIMWSRFDVETGHYRRYTLRKAISMLKKRKFRIMKYDFGEIFLLKLYRLYTYAKADERVKIGVTSPYVKILKIINPLIIGFDSLFRKWGFWADGIWILAKKTD